MWIGIGQVIFVETGGYYAVVSVPNSVSVQLQNLGYTGNAVAGTSIGAAKVSPGGIKGTDGSIVTLQQVFFGSGDPNGSITALRPAMYYTDDGHLWVKLNGILDNTNWGQLM